MQAKLKLEIVIESDEQYLKIRDIIRAVEKLIAYTEKI